LGKIEDTHERNERVISTHLEKFFFFMAMHYAVEQLKKRRELISASELGYSDSDMIRLEDVRSFETKNGLRYLYAPFGVYNKQSLKDTLRGFWPRGLSRVDLKDAYKFVLFDMDEIGREANFMLIHDVLFYCPARTSYNSELRANFFSSDTGSLR
jgi:hypothetical protein